MNTAESLTMNSPEETALFATRFAKDLTPSDGKATIVCLYGDLGSGKTTFVKAIAKALGIQDIVTSPTFVIEKIYDIEYNGFKKMFHIDAYRLKEGSEMLALGWREMISNSENIIFIEWPNYVADVLPKERHNLTFEFIDDTTRSIDVA